MCALLNSRMNYGGIQAGTAMAMKGGKATRHLGDRVFPVNSRDAPAQLNHSSASETSAGWISSL
jgi:hypothetical protein